MKVLHLHFVSTQTPLTRTLRIDGNNLARTLYTRRSMTMSPYRFTLTRSRAAPTTLMLEAMYTFDSVRPEIRYYDHDTQTQRSTHTTRPFACVASTTHGWSRQTIYYRYPSASHAFADYGLVAFDLERAAALIQHWQHRALL